MPANRLFHPFAGPSVHHVPLLMMLGNDGEIDQIVVCQILHIVAVALWAIMALPYPDHLGLSVVMEGGFTADNEYHLTVLFMGM